MVYLGIGIAIVVAGSVSYFFYRRRATQPAKPSDPKSNLEASATTTAGSTEAVESPPPVQPAPPMVSELSSLPESDKNRLLNAVWYRCENPYCNHTKFLDVHHIVSEVEGDSNALDNLIVLCSDCHALADNHETPEAMMKSWILERTERFKSELDWPYK